MADRHGQENRRLAKRRRSRVGIGRQGNSAAPLFPDGKTKLAVIYLQNPLRFKKLGFQDVRVDLIGPEPDRRRTLIETTQYCGMYPSPNNELVALRYMAKSKKEEDRPRDMISV